MKKYFSFFRLRFSMGLQYRAAALGGIVTQFVWGFMEIMLFRAFYRADPEAFPMTLSATVSYIWLQQAFFAFFATWMVENELFDAIINGDIAYELCRPIHIYDMWFFRSVANRLSRGALRCFPILFVAAFVPYPYGIAAPKSLLHFSLFVITLLLGLGVTVSLCMLVYMTSFYTISPYGLRLLFVSGVEFLSGAVIPLPFFPEKLQKVMELLPFASMQNVALRIYSGSMQAEQMYRAITLQLFWFIALTAFGRLLGNRAQKRLTVQGG